MLFFYKYSNFYKSFIMLKYFLSSTGCLLFESQFEQFQYLTEKRQTSVDKFLQ